MADRFPSLDEFDAGQTDVKPSPGAEGSSFLDRERALLGDDANEFATADDSKLATVEDDDGDDDLLGGGESYNYGGGAAQQGDIGGFESAFPDLDANEQVGPGGTITGATHFPAPTSSAPEEESEIVKEWRSKRDADVAHRDEVSAEKKEQTVQEARQAIDDFYESYNDKKDRNIAQTRKEAEEFLAKRDDTTAGGTSWERIGKLVDLSGKGVKGGAAASGKDRFRELLLSLRKDDKAPGASGL